MVDTQEITDVLKRARDLIAARGYQPQWGKDDGPMNIRNAITHAADSYELYCLAVQSFSKMWGGPLKAGLLSWETYKRRSTSQVMDLFAVTIGRLENGKTHPRGPSDNAGHSRIL